MVDLRLGFPCQQCSKTFLSAEALVTHHSDKHFGRMSKRTMNLAAQGDGLCHWCEMPVVIDRGSYHALAPTREHLIPKALNGHNIPANIVLAHRRCNELRGHAEASAFKRLMMGEAVTKHELWPHWFGSK